MREEGDAEKVARMRRNDAIDEDTRSRIADERSYLPKTDMSSSIKIGIFHIRQQNHYLSNDCLKDVINNVIDLIIR